MLKFLLKVSPSLKLKSKVEPFPLVFKVLCILLPVPIYFLLSTPISLLTVGSLLTIGSILFLEQPRNSPV